MKQKLHWIAVCVAVVGMILSLSLFLDLENANTQLEAVTQSKELVTQQLSETQELLEPLLAESEAQKAQVEAQELENTQKHDELEAEIGEFDQHVNTASEVPLKLSMLLTEWDSVINDLENLNYQILDQTFEKVLTQAEVLKDQAVLARDFIKVNELIMQESGINTKALLFELETSLQTLQNLPADIEIDLDEKGIEAY